jgi:SAM-dependent methyltransferase
MDHYRAANLALWNEWTGIHLKSALYDVEGFKAGALSLTPIERGELGDVGNKSLLHLQCHFGIDTLSWARLGARVTGADFSDKAIDVARALSRDIGVEAEFVCSDLYELPNVLAAHYDIVYTSYGVLVWLADLVRWGQVIAHFLRPGGTFYMVEFHPFTNVFDETRPDELRACYGYFHQPEPDEFETTGSYADRSAPVEQPVEYEWRHSLSDVVNALIGAGLTIEFLHEFPYAPFSQLASTERREDGMWWPRPGLPDIPLLFSIQATKQRR